MEYGDTVGSLYVKVRSQIDSSTWKVGYKYLDSLGRATKTQEVDTAGDVFADNEYDSVGRPKRVTNPYRANETKQWTTNVYDVESRVKEVDLPDATKVTTDYGISTSGVVGITKQVTDQAGKKRMGISDGLGRMVRVIEDPAGQNLSTDYLFDTLGNLRKTTQGGQSRYFMYDSIGRLLYARQPEQDANITFSGTNYTDPVTSNNQWSVNYQYNDNGNIISTTDAKNISVTAVYDGLNRIKTRTYSDNVTPNVSFYYDGKGLGSVPAYSTGKTTKVTSSVSETRNTSFDAMGRLLASQQITDGQTYNFGYSYNLSGALMEETYPSGRVVKNVLDNNGDLAIVESKKNANSGYFHYADSFKYDSAGSVTKMQLGNGHWETASYNNREQVTQIGLGLTDSTQNLLKLEFKYNTTGLTDNNGSMREQKITVPTVGSNAGFTATQSYAYDGLNRLQSATETVSSSQTWKQAFSYDRFGNRRFDAANTTTLGSCSTVVCNPAINTSNNRFSSGQGYSYNADGDVTQDATGQRFGYDAESHQNAFFAANNSGSTPDATYFYDGDGKRVKKISSTETTVFVYDAGGKLAAEYSTALATTPQVSYLTQDHLGSPRVTTNELGAVTSRKDFGAFGDETITSQRTAGLGYNPPNVRQDYTGYEKDSESGLEFAQARYYNTQHGRYTSVDPLTASASIRDPQTFNRYSYALNSPYKFTDPLGLIVYGAEVIDPRSNPVQRELLMDVNFARSGPGMSTTEFAPAPPPVDQNPEPVHEAGQSTQQQTAQPGSTLQSGGEPSSLKVLSVDLLPTCKEQNCGNAPDKPFGIQVAITYQVLDKDGKPLEKAGLVPLEKVSNTVIETDTQTVTLGGREGSIGPNTERNSKNTGKTDEKGQFVDAPYGLQAAEHFKKATVNQKIYFKNKDGDKIMVRTNNITFSGSYDKPKLRIRKNKWVLEDF